MPESPPLASQIGLKINGADVDTDVMGNVLSVDVDQHAHLPGMFVIRLQDPGFSLIDEGPFDLTKEIEVSAQKEDSQWVSLIKGEITALEPEFQEGMIARLVVRGYDKSHRLYRDQKTKAHLNAKDSDLATAIAQNVGLQAEVDATTMVYDHILQHNQSDLTFIQERAWRIGYECYVDAGAGTGGGKLIFRKPSAQDQPITLTWGADLLSFSPRMTLAEQVGEVVVRAWSVEEKDAIVGRAEEGALYPDIREQKNGAAWARTFGAAKRIYLDQSPVSQAEADTLAEARLNELSGAFVQAEGVALRRPDIRAGKRITLEALGERFSGTYLVTNARHTYTAEGLKTHFSVRGARTGQIADDMGLRLARERLPGAMIGLVTNTDDPEHWGRVKVKFPWMADSAESDWARVVGIGAGRDAGLYVMPEVDDEVLVVFEQGDIRRPFVVGGLWNGIDAPPPTAPGGGGERPLVRSWYSRTGHHITVYDNSDNKIAIVTQGGHKILLDDANREVKVTSSGGLVLTLADSGGKITLEGNEISVKANGSLKIESGANMNLQAGGQMTIKGAVINLN
ncbi:MAG: VgrG-related protein [Anaerolineae bacterium]|jgi:phage protein D/phage baseplate assembly protein gpV|nr:VgrG-related protein [Anaerolineae bacterium]